MQITNVKGNIRRIGLCFPVVSMSKHKNILRKWHRKTIRVV